MDKRLILTLVTLLLNQSILAENCPSVSDIKANTITNWKAYDSDDDTPLPAKRSIAFKKHIEQFALAEWIAGTEHHNAIRCYYRDKNGSELEAYLQKNNVIPTSHHAYWYQVSGSMHCAAGTNQCLFQSPVTKQTQLAKK